jgi:hypothetical protein
MKWPWTKKLEEQAVDHEQVEETLRRHDKEIRALRASHRRLRAELKSHKPYEGGGHHASGSNN